MREGYNQAISEKKSYIGFLLILMQRLVTSSTRAIRTTLERRLEVLREPEYPPAIVVRRGRVARDGRPGSGRQYAASRFHALANEAG